MALSIGEASAVNEALTWAMGRTADERGYGRVTDEAATEAARLLAGRAYKALTGAGLRPEQVTLRWTHTVRERLIQLASQLGDGLDLADQLAVSRVLDVLDRIDRQAATAAGSEQAQ